MRRREERIVYLKLENLEERFRTGLG